MELSKKTLEVLRYMINEKTQYRSGPELVSFFNDLGSSDTYGQGFPSRWAYTDEKLNGINGTPILEECIKRTFAPVNFIGRMEELDLLLTEFNQYLLFDKQKIKRLNTEIIFSRIENPVIPNTVKASTEDEFLNRELGNVSIDLLGLDSELSVILDYRIKEIENCLDSKSPLALIFLVGSTLEGIFFGMASKHNRLFNSASSAPKDQGSQVKKLKDWTLENFINVSKELALIDHDAHEFSHSLRKYRNYIHPREQMTSKFNPKDRTAKLCLQVLKLIIQDLNQNLNKLNSER